MAVVGIKDRATNEVRAEVITQRDAETLQELAILCTTSLVVDDNSSVVKQEYVNELIGDAVAKSASELRAVAHAMLLEKIGERDSEHIGQQEREQLWREIAEKPDRVRSRGN